MIIELEYLLINSGKDSKGTNQDYLNLKYVLEVKTNTTIEWESVAEIITPLDTISITL